ncbi:ATP-binding protein [Anabaena sp. UHCC 0187]|uniref:AAA family ATPase n=1 Tax=Anabaena sp. UHCC 0187 TaxID=2590018 RepID=UPI001448A328|nr:AAA family ATPase [Anabaena sp. UHCC 0187]MTJ11837.1 ATP-binding protein [Anabaena sp. UHCC 0187]
MNNHQIIELEIKNLRNIKQFSIELPFEEGVYAITGENGIGKSTIFSVLAQLVSKNALKTLFKVIGDENSEIKFKFDGKENTWLKKLGKWTYSHQKEEGIIFHGFFEGSFMFGSRFSDVHRLILNRDYPVKEFELRDANIFIIKNLGKILRNNENFYSGLKKIKTKKLAQEIYRFEGQPYFIKREGHWFAQFFMSSGELLLIGLLNFINETINSKKRKKIDTKSLILIDEIELALHPSAQARLLLFLNDISREHGFCIYFATHSIQIINHIKPQIIYHIQRDIAGNIELINPCYPAYATRNLYTNDGFDFIFLVEDELAKYIVDKIIDLNNLRINKLVKILPCGGWEQVLAMHYDMMDSKLAGKDCKISSILDGDVKEQCEKKYLVGSKYFALEKHYLPIPSIEKFLKKKFIDTPDAELARQIGDKFFHYESINLILESYRNNPKSQNDKDGKRLFQDLIKSVEKQGISEKNFKSDICMFIYQYTKDTFRDLEGFLRGWLQR